MTDFIYYARSLGKVPDRYWYQLNSKTAQENYMEQRRDIYEALADQEDEGLLFSLESEANIR